MVERRDGKDGRMVYEKMDGSKEGRDDGRLVYTKTEGRKEGWEGW